MTGSEFRTIDVPQEAGETIAGFLTLTLLVHTPARCELANLALSGAHAAAPFRSTGQFNTALVGVRNSP